MKIFNSGQMDEMLALKKEPEMKVIDTDDLKLKQYISYYDFLNFYQKELILEMDKESVVYSQYYWYVKAKLRYYENVASDSGWEQEEVDIIENIANVLGDEVDWDVVKKIGEGGEVLL